MIVKSDSGAMMDITVTKGDGSKTTVNGVSASITPDVVGGPVAVPLVMGNKISQGVSGKYYIGLNCHNTPPNIAALIAGLGGNTVRMTPFYRGSQTNWPGTDAGEQVILQTAREAVALGFQPLMTLTDYFVGGPSAARWTSFVREVVRQTPGCIYEFENEPNFNTGGISPQRYLDGLKLTWAAMKAENPNAKLAAPCTNASYVVANQAWCATLMGLPGFWDNTDFWSFHPYNQKPETSWLNDTNSVVTRVRARLPAGKQITFINSESGWVTSRSGEGAGDPSEGYSKMPFMHRASGLSHSLYYALYDDAFGDVGVLNKPWSPIVTDAFKRAAAATEASMYTREGDQNAINTTANWYVRQHVPGGQELICWSVAGNRNARVVVDAAAAGNLGSRMVGSAASSISVTAGRQAITVPLTLRGRILGGPGISFPEFQS